MPRPSALLAPDLSRRRLLRGALALAALAAAAPGRPARAGIRFGEAAPFHPDVLRERARALARAPYRPPEGALPRVLAGLDYDRHRDIRFRPEMALWRGRNLDAEAQFFHLGHLLRNPVHIHEVADGMAREVLYTPELFDFGKNEFEPDFPQDLGFAGFRLHVPLNRPDYLDELAAFLGASYFRALGRGQRYGLSARGIAVDTGLPKGEEFPWFRAFWLERPAPGAEALVVHALLDGPSLAGAYRFRIAPGATTEMEVQTYLYPRAPIELLGIAPLTSMFLFGASDRVGVDDFRPNVHDSDGLQIWTGSGDWLWRPLVNPARLQLSLFEDESPRGFGLFQRKRDFAQFQDLEARYELRPSLWVEPLAPWGRGQVRLLEIPSAEEIHDNIVAFWVPERPVEAGSEWPIGYRLHWCTTPPEQPAGGTVLATRVGGGGVPGQDRDADADADARKFVIDFAGGQLEALAAEDAVEAAVEVSAGEITPPVAQRNVVTGGWRVFFDYHPKGDGPAELRCVLRLGDEVLTETWSYQWTRG